MSYSINHLEEKIAIAKLIQEAINNIKLPEGYTINNNSSVIEFKPQKLIVANVYLNKTPKGDYDASIDLQ